LRDLLRRPRTRTTCWPATCLTCLLLPLRSSPSVLAWGPPRLGQVQATEVAGRAQRSAGNLAPVVSDVHGRRNGHLPGNRQCRPSAVFTGLPARFPVVGAALAHSRLFATLPVPRRSRGQFRCRSNEAPPAPASLPFSRWLQPPWLCSSLRGTWSWRR